MQGEYDDAAGKAAGAGSQAPGGGQERLLLHSVASLVGGNVIPGTGNTFDVATETQRIFLKAIDADEVRRRGRRTSEPSSASGHIHRADYKKVWLEGFARAILVRSRGSEQGYRKLRDVVHSYVRSAITHKSTDIHRHGRSLPARIRNIRHCRNYQRKEIAACVCVSLSLSLSLSHKVVYIMTDELVGP